MKETHYSKTPKNGLTVMCNISTFTFQELFQESQQLNYPYWIIINFIEIGRGTL